MFQAVGRVFVTEAAQLFDLCAEGNLPSFVNVNDRMMCAVMKQQNRIRCADDENGPVNQRTKRIIVYLQQSCLREVVDDLGRIVEPMKLLENPLNARLESLPFPFSALTET